MLEPNIEQYRHAVFVDEDPNSNHLKVLSSVEPIRKLDIPKIGCVSLKEDWAGEKELIDFDGLGDFQRAKNRFKAGLGDCPYISGVFGSYLFSKRAKSVLEDLLEGKKGNGFRSRSSETRSIYFIVRISSTPWIQRNASFRCEEGRTSTSSNTFSTRTQ